MSITYNGNNERGVIMKLGKKMFIGGGIIAIMAVGLVIGGWGLVSAAGPWSGPGFSLHGRCGDAHFKTHGPEIVGYLFWRMDRQVGALNLSGTQRQKYEVWKASIEDHLSQAKDSHDQLMHQFQTELGASQPDVPMLLSTVRTKLDDLAGFANQNLDLFEDLWRSLDADQQQTLVKLIREKAQQHRCSDFPPTGDPRGDQLSENG